MSLAIGDARYNDRQPIRIRAGEQIRRHFFDSGTYNEQNNRGRDAREPSPTLCTAAPAVPPVCGMMTVRGVSNRSRGSPKC